MRLSEGFSCFDVELFNEFYFTRINNNFKHFVMKFKLLFRLVFTFLLLSSIINIGQAQNNLWIVGDKLIDFNNSNLITATSLPQPIVLPALQPFVYSGQIANNNQYAEYDQNGNLLFFIVDGNIFDRDGYMIADADDGDCDICFPDKSYANNYDQLTTNNLVVTKVPGHCDKYYLSVNANLAILDLSLPNHFFPNSLEHMGSLVPFAAIENDEVIYNSINIHGILEQSIPISVGQIELANFYIKLPFSRFAGHNTVTIYEDIYDDNVDGTKYLGLATDGFITQYELRADGAFYLNNNSIPGTNGEGWPPYGAIEYSNYNSQRVAALSASVAGNLEFYSSSLFISRLNDNMSFAETNAFNPHTELISGSTGDIEFSENGRYLFYTIDAAPYLGVVDLQSNEVFELADLVSIQTPANYKYGRIEMNYYQQVPSIYFVTSNGLSILKGCNDLSTAIFIANGLAIGPIPDNNFSTQPFDVMYLLPKQSYKHTQLESQSLTVCCENNRDENTQLGYNVGAGNSSWSYGEGNNPWGATGPVYFSGDLIFNNGSNITINNMEFRFGSNADMIIKAGAVVKLQNSSKLTSYECDGVMWPGVDLLGTTNAANSIDQLPIAGGDQGCFYITNSVIENAMVGIDVGGNIPSNAGGIVRASQSTFRNNYNDVIFKKYRFEIGGDPVQNKSYFNLCTFVTDEHLKNLSLSPNNHVFLKGVDKISFKNCSFMNKTDINTYNWFNRGTGIYSSRASFTVDGSNNTWTGSPIDSEQTTFYKLQYGIRSAGYNDPDAFYTCKEQEFQYCLYGIVNYNTDNVLIYLNNFVLPDAAGFNSNETVERGIYLTNSTGYVVEQNTFDGFDDFQVNDEFPCALGIWVDNSGDAANEIRNNDFNEMKLGTYVTGNNIDFIPSVDLEMDTISDQSGLQLLCNTYTNGRTDIFRDSNTSMRWVQGGNQGTETPGTNTNIIPAGNRFSADYCSAIVQDFVNDPDNTYHIDYWCHNDANTIPDCDVISNINGVHLITPAFMISYDDYSDSDCPNHFLSGGASPGPGVIAATETQIAGINNELNLAKVSYKMIVDKNETINTIEVLNESFPHESQFYRNLLMQRFPLSDEVLHQVIVNSSRLNPWHLTEVFLANSPLKKEILAEITNADILSDFFIAFLNQADAGASLRTLLEMNITGLATQRDHLIQSLAHEGMNYYSDPELEVDQVIFHSPYLAQIENHPSLVHMRERAMYLSANGDYYGALALISEQPLLSSLADILTIENNLSGEWNLADSAQIAALKDIAEIDSDLSFGIAKGILNDLGENSSEPEPNFPMQLRSLEINNGSNKKHVPLLGISPNPAQGKTWIHYPIEAEFNAEIQIFDPKGRLIQILKPNSLGLSELLLEKYESGVYVLQLVVCQRILDNIKLIVIK